MRLRSRESKPTVVVAPQDTMRPIRIQAGGLTFCMDTTEAIDLANQIADAITEYRKDTP